MPYLTFIYISFAKIFCQNFVKKNCKFVFRVSLKCAGIICEKRCEMNLYDVSEVCAAIVGGVCQLREGELIVAAISVYYYPNSVRFGFISLRPFSRFSGVRWRFAYKTNPRMAYSGHRKAE